jgi:hypothetical protein
MNGADEALPPLLILPSAAVNPRIKKTLLSRFPQVEGKYGLTERKKYSFSIATSPNGSMDAEIMETYIESLVDPYPDARDEHGFRLCKKVDSGPGRKGKYNKVNFTAVQYGVHVFPGLPNSTEGTQEMDQVFSYLKTLMEVNRSTLLRALSRAGTGQCTSEHLPIILCGGTYDLENGETITLENAFVKALSKEHLKRAREKCGYVPSTRHALYHPKCRREVEDEVELVMGVPETNAEMMDLIKRIDSIYLESGQTRTDGYKELVLGIQKKHNESIRVLLNAGFDFARIGQKIIREEEIDLEAELSIGVTTVEGTRERQNLLQKASRAGEYYRVTNGGAALGCDDMLIAMERSRMADKAKDLEKRRKEIKDKLQTRSRALDILKDGRQPRRIDELKTCIMWKSGLTKKPMEKKKELMALWETLRDQPDPVGVGNETIEELDKTIERLERGNIREVKETGLFKRAYARKCKVLYEQGQFLGEPERVELIASLLHSLSEEGKQKLNHLQERIPSNMEYVPDCIDYKSDEDDFRSHGEEEDYSMHSVGVLDAGDVQSPIPPIGNDEAHVQLIDDEGGVSLLDSLGVLYADFETPMPPSGNDEAQVNLVGYEEDESSLEDSIVGDLNTDVEYLLSPIGYNEAHVQLVSEEEDDSSLDVLPADVGTPMPPSGNDEEHVHLIGDEEDDSSLDSLDVESPLPAIENDKAQVQLVGNEEEDSSLDTLGVEEQLRIVDYEEDESSLDSLDVESPLPAIENDEAQVQLVGNEEEDSSLDTLGVEEQLRIVDYEEDDSSLDSLDVESPLPAIENDEAQVQLVDDEGDESSSLDSVGILAKYEDMTLEDLIIECRKRNIKANKRFAKQTLINKLLRLTKEEEVLRLSTEDE